MSYPTKLSRLDAQAIRVGGVPGSHKGAQPVLPGRVPSNWYPVNLPAASNGTPTNADCRTLLNTLAPLVADLTVQQSVLLALSYRTVQNVAVSSSASFTVNGVTSTGNSSQFDQDVNLSESVPVDVINKNPSLAFDLALRLGQRTAHLIDGAIASAAAAGFTNSAVGTQNSGAITAANITSAVNDVKGTGEPIFLVIGGGVYYGGWLSNPTICQDGNTYSWTEMPAFAGPGLPFILDATGAAPLRVLGSTAIPVFGGAFPALKNLALTPSAMAFATTDMGTTTGGSPAITPSGTVQYATSISKDPETGTAQFALQLVIGNTGSGNQSVYVNLLGAAICINPARGVAVYS